VPGDVVLPRRLPGGWTCPDCNGTGDDLGLSHQCPACGGDGIVPFDPCPECGMPAARCVCPPNDGRSTNLQRGI
jgi:hypothetical protein